MRKLSLICALGVLLFPAPAVAGDFHDMWLGTWKAHTAPFPGWQDVTRELVLELALDVDGDGVDDQLQGVFYGAGQCVEQRDADGVVVFSECDYKGSHIALAAQSRIGMYAALLHELTHARDFMVTTAAERLLFVQIMGYPGDPVNDPGSWWEPFRGWSSPAELYADAGEWCGLSGRQRWKAGYWWAPSGRLTGSVYSWRPTHDQARQVCATFRKVPSADPPERLVR